MFLSRSEDFCTFGVKGRAAELQTSPRRAAARVHKRRRWCSCCYCCCCCWPVFNSNSARVPDGLRWIQYHHQQQQGHCASLPPRPPPLFTRLLAELPLTGAPTSPSLQLANETMHRQLPVIAVTPKLEQNWAVIFFTESTFQNGIMKSTPFYLGPQAGP